VQGEAATKTQPEDEQLSLMQKKARKLCRLDSTAIDTPVGVMMAPTPKLPPEPTVEQRQEQMEAAMRAHKVSPAHPSACPRPGH